MHTRHMHERSSQDALPLVLLIDDDLVSREVTATVLTMNGYTVHTAENGAGALDLLTAAEGRAQALEPDVILVDAQMPGLSGAELIARLRGRSGAHIYVVSGSQAPAEVTAAADGFLLKPFSPEAFRKLLLRGGAGEAAEALLDRDTPVLSVKILAQFRNLMPEAAVRQVYEAVVSDLGKRVEALDAAIARGDSAEVRRIGHAIKGGCGMAGAVEAARLGSLLESGAGRSGAGQFGDNQLDNSVKLLRELRLAVERLQNMLEVVLPA